MVGMLHIQAVTHGERTAIRLVCKLKIYQGHIRAGREDRLTAITRVEVRAETRAETAPGTLRQCSRTKVRMLPGGERTEPAVTWRPRRDHPVAIAIKGEAQAEAHVF